MLEIIIVGGQMLDIYHSRWVDLIFLKSVGRCLILSHSRWVGA